MTQRRPGSPGYSGVILFKDGREKRIEGYLSRYGIELLAHAANVAPQTIHSSCAWIHNDDGTSFLCYRRWRLKVRLDEKSREEAIRREKKAEQKSLQNVSKSVPRASGRARNIGKEIER